MTVDRFLSRREVMRICGLGLLASPLAALTGCGKRAATSFTEPAGAPYEGTDEQLLDEIQRAAFNFFWNEASQKTGQVKDRALANGNDSRMMSSIAATGFGLTSLCIGDRRGYVAVRRTDGAAILCRPGDQRPCHENIRTRGLAMDAEWRQNLFDGLAS